MVDFNFEWLRRLHCRPETAELYVLRIQARGGLKNAACVDLRTSSSVLIDCAEKYAMRLSMSLLVFALVVVHPPTLEASAMFAIYAVAA